MRRRAFLGAAGALAAAGCTSARHPATAAPRASASPSATARRASSPWRFGVNYTPSSVWWTGLWARFDAHRVRDDLAAIASLGVDHIRVQLLWSVFQPTAAGAAPGPVSSLAKLLDLAGEHGLDVCPSVVTASLSGRQFTPAWATGVDWVTSPAAVAAQQRYVRDLGRAIGKHPRLLGFDLGNEDLGQAPDHTAAHLASWASTLITACRSAAPGKLHSVSPNGIFTAPYPGIVATVGDVSVVHPWMFLAGAGKNGKLEHAATHHAEYNVEHVRSYHRYTGARRKVWVQEMGAPRVNFDGKPVIDPSLAADFLEQSITNTLACQDVWGVTWWCSHDLDERKLPGFHRPEYTLGLFDLSGRPKPTATRLTSVIKAARTLPTPVVRTNAIVGSKPGDFDKASSAGKLPAIVQPAHAQDAAYLARRGITTLL